MKKYCRTFLLAALPLVLAGLLTACQTAPAPTQTAGPSQSPPTQTVPAGQESPPPVESVPPETETPAPAEPPLSADDLAIAVPDFLTAGQQDLYRRAHSLYLHLLGDSIEYAETMGLEAFPPREYEKVTVGDATYLVAQGRYADWDDFDALVHGIFTDRYWEEYNSYPLHVESGGRHCFLDTGIGMGYWYNGDVPDAFRLEKQTETEIEFTLIGHYNFFGVPEGVTDAQLSEGEARGYDYTLEFPIRMVLTERGWRFDEFHSSLVDEEDLPFLYADNEDGTITITKYIGLGGDVTIPAQINGKAVTAIGNTFEETGAFQDCETLTSVVIPEGVTEIQDNAFQGCTGLTTAVIPASVGLLRNCAFDGCGSLRAVYFEGDAPRAANYVFTASAELTVYYREGTDGWGDTWYGCPTETY